MRAFWCKRNLLGTVWNGGCLDYSELLNIHPRVVKAPYFAEGTENLKIFGNSINKGVENLDDHGFPKVQDLVDAEA